MKSELWYELDGDTGKYTTRSKMKQAIIDALQHLDRGVDVKLLEQVRLTADKIDRLMDVSEDVKVIREMVGRKETRALSVWHAITHGFGVTKSEIDKLFKE